MKKLIKYFNYLDKLRASGATNMYGAGIYLVQKFSLDDGEASHILDLWMNTFDASKTTTERAKEANHGY